MLDVGGDPVPEEIGTTNSRAPARGKVVEVVDPPPTVDAFGTAVEPGAAVAPARRSPATDRPVGLRAAS